MRVKARKESLVNMKYHHYIILIKISELQCFAPKLRNNFNIQKRILFPFKCLSTLRVAIIWRSWWQSKDMYYINETSFQLVFYCWKNRPRNCSHWVVSSLSSSKGLQLPHFISNTHFSRDYVTYEVGVDETWFSHL